MTRPVTDLRLGLIEGEGVGGGGGGPSLRARLRCCGLWRGQPVKETLTWSVAPQRQCFNGSREMTKKGGPLFEAKRVWATEWVDGGERSLVDQYLHLRFGDASIPHFGFPPSLRRVLEEEATTLSTNLDQMLVGTIASHASVIRAELEAITTSGTKAKPGVINTIVRDFTDILYYTEIITPPYIAKNVTLQRILNRHNDLLSNLGYIKSANPHNYLKSKRQDLGLSIRYHLAVMCQATDFEYGDLRYPKISVLPNLAYGDRGVTVDEKTLAAIITDIQERLGEATPNGSLQTRLRNVQLEGGVARKRFIRNEVFGSVINVVRFEEKQMGSTASSLRFFDNRMRVVGKELHLQASLRR
jgi:hypothetical protein